MNSAQNKVVYALFNTTGLLSQKENIVAGISNGRTTSTRQLSHEESIALIQFLQAKAGNNNDLDANRMRRKIISMAHQLHWYLPFSQKVDVKRVDNWCIQYGYLHKKLNYYSVKELPKLVSQFKEVFASILNNL